MARQKLQSVTLSPADLTALVQAAIQGELAKLAPQAPKPEREDVKLARQVNRMAHVEPSSQDSRAIAAEGPIVGRDQWEESGDMLVQFGGEKGSIAIAVPKLFNSGSVGWYIPQFSVKAPNGKVYQCNGMCITIKGSKPSRAE